MASGEQRDGLTAVEFGRRARGEDGGDARYPAGFAPGAASGAWLAVGLASCSVEKTTCNNCWWVPAPGFVQAMSHLSSPAGASFLASCVQGSSNSSQAVVLMAARGDHRDPCICPIFLNSSGIFLRQAIKGVDLIESLHGGQMHEVQIRLKLSVEKKIEILLRRP